MADESTATGPRCFKCGGPVLEGWFFVKWCDDCLQAHNAQLPRVPEAEIVDAAGEA